MRESALQKKVKSAIIDKYDKNIWYYHAQDRSQRGIPDIILCFYGIFIAIELKYDLIKNPLTKLQSYNFDRISFAKGFAIQAESVNMVIQILEFIKQNYTLTKHNR